MTQTTEILTVWADGSWLIQDWRDAEIATLCEPDAVLLNLNLATREPVVFEPFQKRVTLYDRLIGPLLRKRP